MLPEENTVNSSNRFEELLYKNRFFVFFLLLGILLIFLGLNISKNKGLSSDKIEIIKTGNEVTNNTSEIIVEIAGQVEKPGVYKLANGSRVEDLLIVAGGISGSADRNWIEKFLNRAAKLTDGQKIYIPSQGEQSIDVSAKNTGGYQSASSVLGVQNGGLVNINSASLSELDALPGIGLIYGQNIIDHRPYSNTEELRSKGVLSPSLYTKIQNLITAN